MPNSLKARLQAGETLWGTFIFECPVPAMPRILKAAGWDYALIDMEHASLGIESVSTLLHVCAAADLPAVVRVPEPSRSFLCRPLDAGAAGVMVPRVEEIVSVPGLDVAYIGPYDLQKSQDVLAELRKTG